ncbi:MAG TPA: hypothetical protein VNX68_04600 [Nitrosopumilaceae archaeon]|nr:hypothetical protein [Nitrosopumilaceae archaeon]
MEDTICFYCGELGESKDHVPPISYPDHYEETERFLVRSCLLCNSLLGNRPYYTFLSRCDYLLLKYRMRFERILSIPIWKDEEINELSGRLKRQVIIGVKKKKYIEKKLLYIENNIKILQGYNLEV